MEQAGQPAAEGPRAAAGTAESTAAAAVGPGPVHQQTPPGPAGASPPDGEQPPLPSRQADPARPSRALVVHPRTLEVLRPLGVTDELLARGDPAPAVRLHLGRREVEARLGAFPLERDAPPAGGVAVPPGVAVHRLTDRPGRGALLVRPDGYIGLRSATGDPVEIGTWLARAALTGASRAP
ncbi:MAG TPA: FAD-dependent monooxygenase [Acidimicrobiales bacterium]|nr:FAD-dependent monooxygenase [Acidimicrobiales bacterium]